MHVKAYLERLKEAARQSEFNLSTYGMAGEFALPVLERQKGNNSPRIYISAGVHGDEPAPPMAIMELLKRKALPVDANFMIFPLINPLGLVAGTRENPDGVDLNRDYGPHPVAIETRSQLEWIGSAQFDLTICMHEDYDANGFYVYSHINDNNGPDFAGLAIEAAKPFTGIDTRTEIDDMRAKDGRMYPPIDVIDRSRTDLPEALRMHFHHGSNVTVNPETPSCQPISQRIEAHCAVVIKVIEAYLRAN